MSVICFEGISTNPEILAISDRVFNTVRLSIQRAANVLDKAPSATLPQNGIERATYNFLEQHHKVSRAALSRLGGLSRTAGSRFGNTNLILAGASVNLSFASSQTVLEQAMASKYFHGLKLSHQTLASQTLASPKWNAAAKNFEPSLDINEYAREIIKALAFKRILDGASVSAPPATAKAKELHLKLASLKAVRRFGLEVTDWGDDHINCGGDGMDSIQQHIKVNQFFINTFKRDGQGFNITPDRTFVKFDLNQPGPWPRGFMANAFLAEKDADGGFLAFLHALWDAIVADVVKLASELALAAIGAGVGAAALSEFPVVGTIVGAIIGAVIGYLVGLLLDSLKDDIFESADNPLGVLLPSQDSLFPGNSKRSPTYTQDFTLGESRYLMEYYWELVF